VPPYVRAAYMPPMEPERREPRSGDRWNRLNEISVAPPGLKSTGHNRYLGLLTAFGRRDTPSPASGRQPAIPGLGHVSLPPAG